MDGDSAEDHAAVADAESAFITLSDNLRVNYPTLLALMRSLRVGLARRLGGWDSPT